MYTSRLEVCEAFLNGGAYRFAASRWPRVVEIGEPYQPLKDLAEFRKKAGSGGEVIGGVVIHCFCVYVGLGTWADDKHFSHGGGD
jgi:hypothetical protein